MKTSHPTLRHLLPMLALGLAPTLALGAQESTVWATADGSAPAHLESHTLAADSAAGPNGVYAVARWSGAYRQGSWTGFGLSLPAWTPTRVELLLAGYLSAPVSGNSIRVTLEADGVAYGPVNVGAAVLNQHVGAAEAGIWTLDLTALFEFPTGALAGPVQVDLRLLRHGPDEGAELWLDAVGLSVRVEDPDETFDLWLGGDAAGMDAMAPARMGVDSPTDVDALECPYDICFLQVRDSSGESRRLSVLLLPDGESVRVGFDSGRQSAPVDAQLSVVLAPVGAPADGLSRARLEVTPLDAAGLPLGEGVSLVLDPALMGPAQAIGSWSHRGDGTYTLDVVAAEAGDLVVAVTAGGVALQQSPVVSFLAP